MTDRETYVKLLEALQDARQYGAGDWADLENQINARLAQPEPAPVAAKRSVRQYYYRVDGCHAKDANDTNCICWHDEGTGPRADAPDLIKAWRTAPPFQPADYVRKGIAASAKLIKETEKYSPHPKAIYIISQESRNEQAAAIRSLDPVAIAEGM